MIYESLSYDLFYYDVYEFEIPTPYYWIHNFIPQPSKASSIVARKA